MRKPASMAYCSDAWFRSGTSFCCRLMLFLFPAFFLSFFLSLRFPRTLWIVLPGICLDSNGESRPQIRTGSPGRRRTGLIAFAPTRDNIQREGVKMGSWACTPSTQQQLTSVCCDVISVGAETAQAKTNCCAAAASCKALEKTARAGALHGQIAQLLSQLRGAGPG